MKKSFASLVLLVTLLIALPGIARADAGHFVVAVQSVPPTLEPMGENSNRMARVVYSIFETLIRMDQFTGELKPGLATAWKRIDDRTVEFTLRQGVHFHNGEEMTSEDVAFSFGPERFASEKAPGRIKAGQFLAGLQTVEAVDKYTVRVINQTPDPLIENRFASRMTEIISKKAYLAAPDWATWTQKPVGTGPYKIKKLKPNNRVDLVRFDGYWGKPAPVEAASFVEVPELSARVAGLRSGEFDIITEVPPDQIETLSKAANVDVLGGPIENIYGLVFDTLTSPVLKDPRIRQAIAYAIDRQALVDALFLGRTRPANSWQFQTFGDLYMPDMDKPLYDPALSKKLLQEAGYKGETIVWPLLPNYYTLELTVTQAMVQMLQAVGLNVKMEVKENWTQVEGPGPMRMMNNASFTCYYQDPSGMLWRRLKPSTPWRTDKFFDRPARFDELGIILESSLDPASRKAAYREMLEIETADPVAVPLYVLPAFFAKRSDVQWKTGVKEFMDLSADNLSFAK